MPREVDPHQAEADRDRDHDQAVADRRYRRLAAAACEVVGHQRGRERNRHDAHQQEQVQHQDGPVHLGDLGHHRVVIQPHDPDGQEADRVGGVLRPRQGQRMR